MGRVLAQKLSLTLFHLMHISGQADSCGTWKGVVVQRFLSDSLRNGPSGLPALHPPGITPPLGTDVSSMSSLDLHLVELSTHMSSM